MLRLDLRLYLLEHIEAGIVVGGKLSREKESGSCVIQRICEESDTVLDADNDLRIVSHATYMRLCSIINRKS